MTLRVPSGPQAIVLLNVNPRMIVKSPTPLTRKVSLIGQNNSPFAAKTQEELLALKDGVIIQYTVRIVSMYIVCI